MQNPMNEGKLNKVKIIIRTQGQYFATYAAIYRGRKLLHVTRDFPYGFTGPAYEAAEGWIKCNL
jgi:hypothetical protein